MSTSKAFELFMSEVWQGHLYDQGYGHSVKTATNLWGAVVTDFSVMDDGDSYVIVTFPDGSETKVLADGTETTFGMPA